MADEITQYGGKPLSEYDLWSLGTILHSLKLSLKAREKASQHHKFDKENNKKAMDFPPPNPKFLELKNAVELEIRKRQGL